jgi:hypothetical protein
MDPFPSSPSKPSRYSITAIKTFPGEAHARTYATSFREAFGAKTWLRIMIGNEECVRRGNELTTASGIKLRSMELQAILDYELTGKERDYRLPDEYIYAIARFRRGTWEASPEPVVLETRTTTVVASRAQRKAPSGAPIAIEKPAGFVSITELCRGTPVSPMNARALLRACNYAKPAYGWLFAPTQVAEIKKLVGL